MLVRDINGQIVIISRKDCKDERVYNKKLYDIAFNYTAKYKSIFVNHPKDTTIITKTLQKNSSDD